MPQEILKPAYLISSSNLKVIGGNLNPLDNISDDPNSTFDTSGVTMNFDNMGWHIKFGIDSPIDTLIGDVKLRVLWNASAVNSFVIPIVKVYVGDNLVYQYSSFPKSNGILRCDEVIFPSSLLAGYEDNDLIINFDGNIDDLGGNQYTTLYSIDMVVETTQSTTPPNVPSNTTPLNSSITNELKPLFSADIYHLDSIMSRLTIEMAKDIDFTVNNVSFSSPYATPNTKIYLQSTNALTSDVWYWKARAESVNGYSSDFTEIRTLTIQNNTPNIPTNLSPNNGDSISGIGVNFNGTVSDIDFGTLKLVVEISTDELFNNPTIVISNSFASDSIATIYSGNLGVGNFYWRCRAFDGEKYSDYTSTNSFTLVNATPTMSNHSPATQTRINVSNTYLYVHIVDEDNDRVQAKFEMSQDSSFATGVTTKVTPLSDSGNTFSMQYTNLTNGVWYWRVKANDNKGLASSFSSTFVLYVEVPSYESLKPDGLLESVNLSGSVADLIEQPNTTWLTAITVGTSTLLRTSFETPLNILESGAGKQTFIITARRNNTNSTPSMTIYVYENGIERFAGSPTSITATNTGITTSLMWDSNILSNANGVGVECRVVTTSTGSGKNKTDIEFGHVQWNAFTKFNAGTVVNVNPPVANIISVDRNKISNIAGVDRATVLFSFDKDITEWTVNVGGNSYTTGIVADSGIGTIVAGTQISAVIDYTELLQEGSNRVNIYGRDSSGSWASYQQ